MRRSKQKPEPVEREALERTARILGHSSAAARALREADTHSGPVAFWRCGDSILVEKLTICAAEVPR